jgi:hypothetical protein
MEQVGLTAVVGSLVNVTFQFLAQTGNDALEQFMFFLSQGWVGLPFISVNVRLCRYGEVSPLGGRGQRCRIGELL